MSSSNIKDVKEILRAIGTPFNKPERRKIEEEYCIKLYDTARKNKIGLLFLESIEADGLPEILSNELTDQRSYHKQLRETLKRAAYTLNTFHPKYAVIKSLYPFPAVPNDVDAIIFGARVEYDSTIQSMLDRSFEILDRAPLEVCFHDRSRAEHKNPEVKDPFDVDLYSEVGAGYIIYMDKTKLQSHTREVTIDDIKVKILETPTELALSMFHSLYPERIFTLLLHYHILHSIDAMDSRQIDEFLMVCKEHKITDAALITLSLCEIIQQICFGEAPSKLSDIRYSLGKRKALYVANVPYHYSIETILKSFWRKRNDMRFTKSFLRQLIFMLNPKYARYVFDVNRDRARRETY